MAKNLRPSGAYQNVILQRLSLEQQESIGHHLTPLDLKINQVIYEPDQPIEYAYFVEQGLVSIVSNLDGDTIEVSAIGREGMVGSVLLLGVDSVPYQYFVQIAGHGYRISADILKEECRRNDVLRDMILKYQAAFLTMAMQGAACNGLHQIQQRCCRWILMSQDRVRSDVVPLTHEFLGMMLGVRRASVSDVLQPMQERGWLKSSRGEITILDRKALESTVCECYRLISKQYHRMLD
jgi:CRP-like cAMP-binding protein